MYKNNRSSAFTLAEIMVGISIIGFIAIGASKLNFSRLSKIQEAEIEIVKIINIIEETKNNALIGRGIGTNLETPLNWMVRVDASSAGSIESIWSLASGTGSYSSWENKVPFEISNMRCQTVDGLANDAVTSSVVTLTFTGSLIGLTGCSSNSFKKLVFDYGLAGNTKEISINTVTGVIEKN